MLPEGLDMETYRQARSEVLEMCPYLNDAVETGKLKEDDIRLFVFTYLEYTQTELAEVFRVTQQAIHKRLKKVRKEVVKNNIHIV